MPCNCCETPGVSCPSSNWTTLHRWIGPRIITNDMRDVHLNDFKISFTNNGTTEVTGTLSKYASANAIKTALEGLSNIGSGLVVSTNSLPDDLVITFSSALTTNKPLSLMSIIEVSGEASASYEAEVTAPGVISTSDEVQTIKRRLSVWDALNLENYLDLTFVWRILVYGTGDIPALTKLCLNQFTKQVTEWTAPISEVTETQHLKIELDNVSWEDGDPNVHGDVTGGTYSLTLKTGLWEETTDPLNYDATASEVETALRDLPNSSRAGQISVSGGPITYAAHMTVSCEGALEVIDIICSSELTGIPPTMSVVTKTTGGTFISGITGLPTPVNEEQVILYDFPVSSGDFKIRYTGVGTSQTTNPIQYNSTASQIRSKLGALINLDEADVGVVRGDVGLSVPRKFTLTFIGSLAATDIPEVTLPSVNLQNIPTLKVTKLVNSEVQDFRNEFMPLNVGTTWKGFIRKGWGNSQNRALLGYYKWKQYLPAPDGTFQVTEAPCGHGLIESPVYCSYYYTSGEGSVQGLEAPNSAARAVFIPEDGTIEVSITQPPELTNPVDLPYEFAFQIKCLPCNPDSSLNLWGENESSILENFQIYDVSEPMNYSPEDSYTCGVQEDGNCRQWSHRFDNVAYLNRIKFGPDGYDGPLVNDMFFADNGRKARNPPCSPEVVLLGDGHYLEFNLDAIYPTYEYVPPPTGPGFDELCEKKLLQESIVEHPVSALNRLKLIYGTSFSYWGGWIHQESLTSQYIRCRFDEYDLTKVKVLFLSGLSIGYEPNADHFPSGLASANDVYPGDDFFVDDDVQPSACWWRVLQKQFLSGTLEPLKNWLDLGGKVLVLDGGAFPLSFLSALGLETTVEKPNVYGEPDGGSPPSITPNTVNGSFFTLSQVYGPSRLDGQVNNGRLFFDPIYVDPVKHPFTHEVLSGLRSDGTMRLINDPTFEMSNLVGQLEGATGATCGLISVTQKARYEREIYAELFPAGPFRTYTTCLPLVNPGPNSTILGRVKGELPISPYTDVNGNVVTISVDYPCIVAELWRSTFRLGFTDNAGDYYYTGPINGNATSDQVKDALEALPNIGVGISAIGGPLPSSIEITFSSPSTTGININLLSMHTDSGFEIEIVKEGGSGTDEVQVLKGGKKHSRVLISGVSELVEPDAWGTNWREVNQIPTPGQVISQDGNSALGYENVEMITQTLLGFTTDTIESYNKNGYHFGLGLSNIASAKFLTNLLERINDY